MTELLAASAALAAACPPAEATKARIAAIEAVWQDSRSADEIEAFLADDFQRAMPNGDIWTKARQVDFLRSRSPAPAGMKGIVVEMAVETTGCIARAQGIGAIVNQDGAELDRIAFDDKFEWRDGNLMMTSASRKPARKEGE